MLNLWNQLLRTRGFMPHGHCYLWDPGLVGLHLSTDLVIGLSYVAISFTLAYLVWRAKADIPFRWIFISFGLFIIACGATHFMEVWTLWAPVYWLSGGVKLITALASLTTAIVLPPLIPKSLTLIRSAKLLESTLEALQHEIAQRELREEEIRRLNAELEQRVEARTSQLAEANTNLARMAAVVEHSNDAIGSLDLNFCITSWNPAAERMYGYRAEEVVGRSNVMLGPPALSSKVSDMVERIRKGERVDSFEATRIHKNGTVFNVHIAISPIQDQSGNVQGISFIARDITERKRAEELLRLTVEGAPNAIVMADEEGRIVLVNAQTEQLFGYRREELLGQEMETLVPLRYQVTEQKSQDLHGIRKDGSEFPIEIGSNPIQMERGTWVLSAIVDVTERKASEKEIQRLNRDLERRVEERTQDLTAANADLEAFSYSVSHDLRAPVRHIAGFSSILAEECGPGLSPEHQRHLERIQSGAQHMGALIDDLLNLSRIGRQLVSRRMTSLDEVVRAVIEDMQPETVNRKIEWRLEELEPIECDPGLIKQVFINLLSNAIKYSVGRECAVIHIGQIVLSGERAIFVRDNGAGFDMQYAGNLFGVFQRLHRQQDFKGTGVGLAIVERIIRKHGGRVWADAELDKGACFFLTIPPVKL